MSKPATDKPVRRDMVLTRYAIGWSIGGAMALGYLGVALFAPDILAGLTPAAKRPVADADAMTKVVADVNGLKSSLTKLQLDVASVKSDVATQASQTCQGPSASP